MRILLLSALVLQAAAQTPNGAGGAFHYNRPNGADPLTAGMKNDQPIAVDWDGDGRIDMLQRNLYSTTFGEPWWGLFFWRNLGKSLYARSIRLTAGGAPIADPYASYQLIDWNNDGRLDVLSGVGSGPERGRLKVYLNAGRKDAQGLPVLEPAGAPISWSSGGELTYGMRLFPWLRAGALDLFTLRLRVQYFPTQEMDAVLFRHPRTPEGFGPGAPVSLAGSTVYGEWPSALYDFNRDGRPDLVGADRGLATKPPKSCVVGWVNSGTGAEPQFTQPAQCLIDVSPEGFAIPAPAADGLLVSYMGGWLRHHRQSGGRWQKPELLLARDMPVSSGGYSSVEVADWEGDGDLDFIMGNEVGFVQLVENISRNGRTMFQTARQIPLVGGGTMYAARWQFIDDADPERPLGQSKPAYVDWDGDGDLDMLVGNNSNRIAYFENIGTRRRPRFAAHRTLTHDAGEHFSFRARPAPVDWNGDGLIDLVAGYSGARNRNDGPHIAICLYLRYRRPDGTLGLRAGQALRSHTGAELRTPIPYHHGFEVVDWDGDGDFDILANERTQLVLYRNTGARAFARELILMHGKPLSVSHHETSMKAVDWDRDGKLDLITGGESGWVYYFHRSVLDAPPPASAALRRPDRK